MKYLKLFENFTEDDFKKFIKKSVKTGDISLNVDVDKLTDKFKNSAPKIGTFEYFVNDGARFISIADSERMAEYVSKLKELGLDVSYLYRMLPDYVRYHEITYIEDDLRSEIYDLLDDEKDQEDEIERKIEVLLDEQNSLRDTVEDFEKEVRKVTQEAKDLI